MRSESTQASGQYGKKNLDYQPLRFDAGEDKTGINTLPPRSENPVCSRQNVCDRSGVVLGFALQEAARAAQVLALLTSFRSCLRLDYVLGEKRISRSGFAQGERET
jgi:hypothetical protein